MSDVNTYTLDADGLLYYLVDILPPAAADGKVAEASPFMAESER